MGAKDEKVEMPTQVELTDPFIIYGTAKKASWDMNAAEQAAVAKEAYLRVRRNAFAHNLPICFESDGYVCL